MLYQKSINPDTGAVRLGGNCVYWLEQNTWLTWSNKVGSSSLRSQFLVDLDGWCDYRHYHQLGSPRVATRTHIVRDPIDRVISTFYWNWYQLPYRLAQANTDPLWLPFRDQILKRFPQAPEPNWNPGSNQLWPILEDRFEHFLELLPEMIQLDPHTQPQAHQQQLPYGGCETVEYVDLGDMDRWFLVNFGYSVPLRHNVMPYHRSRSRRRLITPEVEHLIRQLYAVDYSQWNRRSDKYAK